MPGQFEIVRKAARALGLASDHELLIDSDAEARGLSRHDVEHQLLGSRVPA
jgi:hypothetical protein